MVGVCGARVLPADLVGATPGYHHTQLWVLLFGELHSSPLRAGQSRSFTHLLNTCPGLLCVRHPGGNHGSYQDHAEEKL